MKRIIEKILTNEFLVIFLFITNVLTVFNYRFNPNIEYRDKEIIRVDTIYNNVYIKDTLPPITKTVYKTRIDTVIYRQIFDSLVPINLNIPIVQKTYSNSLSKDNIDITYRAWVSGYEPSLDGIDFDITNRNTNTIVKQKRKFIDRFNYGINVGVGYGIINKEPDVYVGFGLQYNFNNR